MSSRTLRRCLVSAALAPGLTLTLAACGRESSPQTPAAPQSPTGTAEEPSAPTETPTEDPTAGSTAAKTVEITLEGDEVTPLAESLDLAVGDRLELVVTSDRVGELHVHATPERSFEVRPGTETFAVRLTQPGQVDIEEHESGALLLRVLVR